MIKNKRYLVLSLSLLATMLTVDMAQAKWRLSIFVGTRAQVTNACNGNMSLSQSVDSEGMGYSFCVNYDNGSAVRCSDANICTGSWDDGVPDVTAGGGPRGRPLGGGSSLAESGSDYGTPGKPQHDDGGHDGPIYN